MEYPLTRLRRNRSDEYIRALVCETQLNVTDLVYPMFVLPGEKRVESIAQMPGINRYSIDTLLSELSEIVELGILAVALFPVVDSSLKTQCAKEAYNQDGLIQQCIKAIKSDFPGLGVISDIALDPFTSHGHDGLLNLDGKIDNDRTVEVLVQQALSHAQAGADIVAPSDMMDGRIKAIRLNLEQHQQHDVKILSYAAKYASNFYGPFRSAIGSSHKDSPPLDKSTYQLNPANVNEALREVELDLHEGADMVMVKPGMPYLDIIRACKDQFRVPIFAYQVSGEYAMIKAAAENGWLQEDKAVLESMLAFKRAGCCGIFTYYAKKIARILVDKAN